MKKILLDKEYKEYKLTNKEVTEFVKQLADKQELSISDYLHLQLHTLTEEAIKELKEEVFKNKK